MRVKVGVRARVRVRGSPPHLVAGEVGIDHLPLLLLVHLVAGEVGIDPDHAPPAAQEEGDAVDACGLEGGVDELPAG